MFKGSFTALITPFRDGAFDAKAMEALVDRQIAAGTHGLVPCGTTGEAPCLVKEEHLEVIETTVRAAAGKVPVVAGCGSNSTQQTLDLCAKAGKLGIDGLLIVCPYYNRPSQEGLYRHFKAVAGSTDLPVIIYNIPGRTGVDMTTETMARLFGDCENIVGVKDATGDIKRLEDQVRKLGPDFLQLCGEDLLTLEFMQKGGHGCISVTSNIAPGPCAEFQNLCLAGDFAAARALHSRLSPLHKNLFVETNPVPVKYAASLLGFCAPDVRLPLAPLAAPSKQAVEAAMQAAGLEF